MGTHAHVPKKNRSTLLKVPAFYTWKSYLSAVCQYNKMAVADHVPTFLGESETKVKAMTVVAMMANLKVETLHWTACKDRPRAPPT